MTTQCTIDVRYPDCDAMGIVHHAVYPIWYEIARMDFFAKMGFSYSDMHALGIDPPMVDLHLQYAAPARYPGQVTVTTKLVAYAPKKLTLEYAVTFEGRQIATATSLHIWTGPNGKSLDMAANHPDIYAKIEAAHEA
jgi:acyl-CoA thioester hydrolase